MPVVSGRLCDSSIQAFRNCALQDIHLGEYPGVKDSWVEVISSQGCSLLSLDLSRSDVTDSGLALLKGCSNLQSLALDCCEFVTERGLGNLSGLTNLTFLSLKKSNAATAEGLCALSSLHNLERLDLERCFRIHGALVNLKGLMELESLNLRCCKCITDMDMKALSGLSNLKELQLSKSNITDFGVAYLRDVGGSLPYFGRVAKAYFVKLGTPVESLNLLGINLRIVGYCQSCILKPEQMRLSDDGCDKFSGLNNLKVLSLAFNNVTDACLVHLKGPTKLGTLNVDSCKIRNEGLTNLTGLQLKNLELSDTEVGSDGLCHLSGLTCMENLNLSFTLVTDSGLKRLSGLVSLKSLNLDACQITDAGLAALNAALTGLKHLDLFGAWIADAGMNYLQDFKNLRSFEICGGGLTDAGVKHVKDLTSLTVPNLSQNCNLTDKTLELISGLKELVSLNVSNSLITDEGLQHLKPLKNLRSLSMESCKVTASEIKKLQSAALPNLMSFRPE